MKLSKISTSTFAMKISTFKIQKKLFGITSINTFKVSFCAIFSKRKSFLISWAYMVGCWSGLNAESQ